MVVSIVAALTVVAITVVYARAWRWASVLLRLVLPPSVLLLRVLITAGQAITALPAPVGCPYGYYYYAPYNRCVPTP